MNNPCTQLCTETKISQVTLHIPPLATRKGGIVSLKSPLSSLIEPSEEAQDYTTFRMNFKLPPPMNLFFFFFFLNFLF